MDDRLSILYSRRSVRDYTSERIGQDDVRELLQAAMGGEHFPESGVFHLQGLQLSLEAKILLVHIDETEILQPYAFGDADRLMDEFLNGRGEFYDELFNRIPGSCPSQIGREQKKSQENENDPQPYSSDPV